MLDLLSNPIFTIFEGKKGPQGLVRLLEQSHLLLSLVCFILEILTI